MSDHSQIAVVDGINLAEALAVLGACCAPTPAPTTEAEIAICPSQRSAQVYVLDPEPARRAGAARGARPAERRGRGRGDAPATATRRWCCSERGELRFAAGRRAAGRARRAAGRGGRRRRARARLEDGRASERRVSRTRSGGSGRRCAARTRATCWCRPARGYEFVDWGGVGSRGRRQPRLAAPRRLARRAAVRRDGPDGAAAAVVASAT